MTFCGTCRVFWGNRFAGQGLAVVMIDRAGGGPTQHFRLEFWAIDFDRDWVCFVSAPRRVKGQWYVSKS